MRTFQMASSKIIKFFMEFSIIEHIILFIIMNHYKFNKIHPLDNPYHKSNTTLHTDTKSQIFHLNQRSKVILSQSSDDQQNIPIQTTQIISLKAKQPPNQPSSPHEQLIRPPPTPPKNIHESIIKIEEQQELNEGGLGKSPTIKNVMKNSFKPDLNQAKQISDSKGSLIDQIQEEAFAESTVLNDGRTTPQKRRKKIFASNRNSPRTIPKSYKMEVERNGCPHTQCLIKSLDIIDKMACNKEHRKQKDRSEIQKIILQINLQIDYLHNLQLESVDEVDNKVKLDWVNLAAKQLVARIKQQEYVDETLCRNVQQLCQNVHYFQMVRGRYMVWKLRLQNLSEMVKDILLLEQQKKLQHLSLMKRHIDELEKAQIYHSQKRYNLIQAYNRYINNQRQLLMQTYDWVKHKHF